ncbi:MATE family efflux transporter, partial [Treponema porcinum]|uniref:MATE family efflux transporter n=1 Tax=Treponema porcinum TaxID=261392 RepID=UPI00235645E1
MSSNTSPVENKMGTMPVVRLILNMSLPMVFSMLIQALYNIVDSIFVAQIGEDALTAVSLAFPVQNLMISFAVGTSVGVNAMLSMKLGQREQESVNKFAMNGVFLSFCTYAVFFVLGLTCVMPYLQSQTSSAYIIEYGREYLLIVTSLGFGLFGGVMFDRLLQATGRTFLAMISQIVGAVINIIFDPL